MCIRDSVWGVGTRMITSQNNPALGGVYKLSAEEVDGTLVPRIKISENPAKITNPGKKKVLRIYSKEDRHALADLIALDSEIYDEQQPLTIFDPENTWKRMTLTDYTLRPLLVPVFRNGRQVYESPDLHRIAAYAKEELDTFWSEYKRLHRPQRYKVDLSQNLYNLKQELLARHGH